MSHLDYIDNFNHDLLRSQKTPLLIELCQDDIKRLYKGDAKGSSASFVLLDTMLDQLRSELKGIKNLATLKESLKAAASVATGGMLNDFIGDQLDKGMDFIFDVVGKNMDAGVSKAACYL
ncbi:MAG: hypothetical protein ACI86X_001958 [Moritella sp.]|jgi:hypothetical protein